MAQTLILTAEEFAKLRDAMEWVIPRDAQSPGAGTLECARHLIALVQTLGDETIRQYKSFLESLTEADLEDRSNSFAQTFIDHVRDCYYGYDDTGAWADIGFGKVPRL